MTALRRRQIEKVAETLHSFTGSSVAWADLSEEEREAYRGKARAALEVVKSQGDEVDGP